MQTFSDLAGTYTCVKELDQIFQDLFKLSPDHIRDEMTMEDVEVWDSLCHMELIVSIEQKFGIELTFDEISRMQNVGEIRKIVTEKTSA